jgi:hypothetical protein
MLENVLVPIALFFFLFGAPVLAFIVTRVLAHRERLEMIRHGIVPPAGAGRKAYRDWRRQQGANGWGAGSWQAQSQTAGPGPVGGWAGYDDEPQRALYKGIRTAFVGFAILVGLSFIGGTPLTPGFHGGPWLLGGLIPMFVGIAQVIIALLSGAQLPGVGPSRGVSYAPPPGPGMPPPPPPGFGGAPPPWQPQQPGRSPFEEIGKPPGPPDLR